MSVALAAAAIAVRILSHEAPPWLDATCGKTHLRIEAAGDDLVVDGKPQRALEAKGGHWLLSTGSGAVREYDGRLRVTASHGRLDVVLEASLEEYVARVVASETLPGTPRAALEAQAIVSRSFALAGADRHDGAHLCDLAHCQVLRGAGLDPAHLAASRDAALATAGRVLRLPDGAIAAAPFTGACGGHTADPREVFGGDGTGASAVDDPGCPLAAWSAVIPRAEFERTVRDVFLASARLPGTPAVEQLVFVRGAGGVVAQVREPGGAAISGDAFARALDAARGFGEVRSARFEVTPAPNAVRLEGQGLGHGVGLCQTGAALRARQGASAEAILAHYFPHARISRSQ